MLCPRLEEWIVEAAREAKTDLNRYNLPKDPIRLHAVININEEPFKNLVKELLEKSNRVIELQAQLGKKASM